VPSCQVPSSVTRIAVCKGVRVCNEGGWGKEGQADVTAQASPLTTARYDPPRQTEQNVPGTPGTPPCTPPCNDRDRDKMFSTQGAHAVLRNGAP
jgi:hypothetical protein